MLLVGKEHSITEPTREEQQLHPERIWFLLIYA